MLVTMSGDARLPAKQEAIDIPPHNGPPQGGLPAAMAVHHQAFSGPLPPPELLGKYESLCPGSADRIIRLAEDEAEHRRSIEQAVVRSEMEQVIRDSREAQRGQYCALLITLAAIGAGAYTALAGHEIAGSIIGVGGIGSIVTSFLIGRHAAKSEDSQKPPAASQQPSPKRNRKKR